MSDVNTLHYAMRGVGTDTKTIIQLVSHRTSTELAQIANVYFKMFGKTIQNSINQEESIVFNLKIALNGLFEGRTKFIESMAFS